MRNQIHLFKSKRFLPLFIAQFFGAFNDNAFKNALLIWFTYDVSSYAGLHPSMMVTLAAGLLILPFFLFSATAGQVADKYEKSWLAQKIKMAEIILMIGCSILFFTKNVYGLLILLFLMGTQSTFFGPIKYSLLPEHLRDDELIAGNGLIGGGTFLSILLGTIFGGIIVLTKYGTELLSFFVITFAVIGWLSSRFIPSTAIGDSKLKIGWNLARETYKIIGYAKKERTVWLSIIGISWFWLIGIMFLTQLPTYTKEIIGGNEHIVTLFLTVFSVGIGIGSVWCNKLMKGEINGRLVPYGLIGITVTIVLFVIMSSFYGIERIHYLEHALEYKDKVFGIKEFFALGLSSWGVTFSLLMLAICGGIYTVPLYAIMQHRSDERYLARIIAANNMMNALFMVFASIGALILFLLNLTVTQILLTVGLVNIPMFFVVSRIVKKTKHTSKIN